MLRSLLTDWLANLLGPRPPSESVPTGSPQIASAIDGEGRGWQGTYEHRFLRTPEGVEAAMVEARRDRRPVRGIIRRGGDGWDVYLGPPFKIGTQEPSRNPQTERQDP